MGRKCNVEGCLSDSNRPEDTGVTFHKVPMHSDIRPKWMSLCRIPEDKKNIKVIFVCSRHFLRADFCNFKGKKYMLKQGVLPSVFPWDKSKLEAIKAEVTDKGESQLPEVSIKEEIEEDVEDVKPDISIHDIKNEVETKEESSGAELQEASQECNNELNKEQTPPLPPGAIDFTINSKIKVLDFNNIWCPANIVEVDYEENEVLIHFENSPTKYDEWINMDSPRLRPLGTSQEESSATFGEESRKGLFSVGEKCLACWSDSRKFPATVTKVLDNEMYEVLFDDGFVKTLKVQKMSKTYGKPMHHSPLFDPVQGTKQERREKKRKINVAELFGKRQRLEQGEENKHKTSSPKHKPTPAPPPPPMKPSEVPEEEIESWAPQWHNGLPVGVESTIDSIDGLKKSYIVSDPRLPLNWKKHLTQRTHGVSAGKWDIVIVSPDNKRFRSKNDIKHYLEDTQLFKYNENMFDFTLNRPRVKRQHASTEVKKNQNTPDIGSPASNYATPTSTETNQTPSRETTEEEEVNTNLLKIPIIDDAYKCPIEGCGKNFRRENLAQMHVKHYHPEYTKFLDSTPNVADLAYARTVGDSLDKSPVSVKTAPPPKVKTSTPKISSKLPQSPSMVDLDVKPQSPSVSKTKDSEIIKLLNTKPNDSRKEQEPIHPLPPGLPPNMYPDIKLKDLLGKSEGIPKRDDLNLKTLGSTRPPTGIKTLLPVVRNPPELKTSDFSGQVHDRKSSKSAHKRKRGYSELLEPPRIPIKEEEILETTSVPPTPENPPVQEPSNIIIEGGKVIKIVRMKQEEIINCTCGFPEEDGLMIQCELCLCWQHAYCNNIERESQVPEKYVCYICQNPYLQRSSRKYFHDQDWLTKGTLPMTNYHSKDEEELQKRFEKLKKSHDLSGGLLELQEFVHTLNVKLKVAEAKNHPKLYLWSKPWEKLPLPEKIDVKPPTPDKKTKLDDHQYIKEVTEEKPNLQNDSMLMMILKDEKEPQEQQSDVPIIPQPEAAIDSADCRLNLLDHIAHSQTLVEERLDEFEKQIIALEEGNVLEEDENYSRTRQTLQMLMKDLNTLQEFSQNTSI